MLEPSRSFLLLQLALLLLSLFVSSAIARKNNVGNSSAVGVTYDGRSLIINGKRELLFSGSIHYTRSTPDMWPELIRKAKRGGLNVIQTYVFWNAHEPVKGQWNFEGQYDLVSFIKLIAKNGMYVTLRVGPFIQAEWNHGGLPYWLREVPGIIFRSNNKPFKRHMEKYVRKVINMMKVEKLFASQGGPIILAQIENEYNSIQLAYRELGDQYVQWAGNMAVGLNIGVPWIMCKQRDAPDPVINTCNGRHCGDTFTGPNKPHKPALWTENWTAQFRVWGDPPSQRAAEDIAFSIARFFSKDGNLANYYMYHGGTNFGRTSSIFSTTRYYDEAPLDEYGLEKEPKWSHLKDLHRALQLCKKPLLYGKSSVQKVSDSLEIRTYEKTRDACAGFLINNDTKVAQTIKFRGVDYFMPPLSISILPDCKTVVYNTMQIVSQHNVRNFVTAVGSHNLRWKMFRENIPTANQLSLKSKVPEELYGLTKDTTDYAWYTTSFHLDAHDLPMRKDILPVLRVASMGHAMVAFVNGEYIGSGHGSHTEKSFVLQQPINLRPGTNNLQLLAMTVGFPDSGAYMEHRYAGPRGIEILGLNTGTIDLSENGWTHQVGLNGEKNKLFTAKGARKVQWTSAKGKGPALTWYKTKFDAPEGTSPVVVRLRSMSKGMTWVNGKSIGRYWSSYTSPLGEPTQSEYHIPRAFLKPKGNNLIILEEEGGNPDEVEILKADRDVICSLITENHPPHIKFFEREAEIFKAPTDNPKPAAHLTCPDNKVVQAVEFASFGDPTGVCGNFFLGTCNSPDSKEVVEKQCLGKPSCTISMDRGLFKGKDGCPGIKKALAVQLKCGPAGKQ